MVTVSQRAKLFMLDNILGSTEVIFKAKFTTVNSYGIYRTPKCTIIGKLLNIWN